jgi:methionyl-tRNA synthetase
MNIMAAKNFYITTAIDYANGRPHLGHAYEKILSDVIARYKRLTGTPVYFLTGLDEHGQKVQQSAEKANVSPQSQCDAMAEVFKDLCRRLEITHDDYIRTTEPRHKKVVSQLLQRLFDEGKIYKAQYSGFYSTRAEQFLQEKDRLPDGSWPEIFGEVTELTESNYFFKLSDHQQWLIDYVHANADFIYPRYRAKDVLEFLKEPLGDLCISRPVERLSWGIPLPFDSGFVTYVWFDALINYISAVGYGTPDFERYWPADFHVIGKDILAPAHAIYWPIMLKACGIALPKTILTHGWWLASGEKMSKSIGNVIDPLSVIDEYGPDAFRYYLMREMTVGQDSDFTLERFLVRYTSDLGNDLGNLVSRALSMVGRYTDGIISHATISEEPEIALKAHWERVAPQVQAHYDGLEFHLALDVLWTFVRELNRYAETRAPWKLSKSTDTTDRQRLETTLSLLCEGLRLVSVLLEPVMPAAVSKIRTMLGHASDADLSVEIAWNPGTLSGKQAQAPQILFPRLEKETV